MHLASRGLGWDFPSLGYSAGIIVWKLGTLAVLVYALRRYENRGVDADALGLAPAASRSEVVARSRVAVPALIGSGALFFLISNLPGVGTSAGSAQAYGSVTKVGTGLLLFELVVRYPLTVFAEEAFFRGFLQPRLTWAAPVLSGVLWAGHHFQQASTILSLVPLGAALGIIRWWTGDIRASAGVHYVSNAASITKSRIHNFYSYLRRVLCIELRLRSHRSAASCL